jgi:hypothetical protein
MALLHQFHAGILACPNNQSGLEFLSAKHQGFILDHIFFLLSSTDCLNDFDAVSRVQGSGHMGPSGDHFHIDGDRGAIAVGNTELFEQTAHCAAGGQQALLTVDVDLNHRRIQKQKPQRLACGHQFTGTSLAALRL